MRPIAVSLFLLFLCCGTHLRGASLPVQRVGHALVLPSVYINGQGPFRMLVDTGASSSAIRPAVARRIGLEAKYRVEQVTATGSTLVEAALGTIGVGPLTDHDVELLIGPVGLAEADGVLGQSFLGLHDYLLDYHSSRIHFEEEAPAEGHYLAFEKSDGRPVIRASVDGKSMPLVIDSGAPTLILFRPERQFSERANLHSHTGIVEVGRGRAEVEFTRKLRQRMDAAELPHAYAKSLLPTSAFRSVYVANSRGIVILRAQ